MSDKKWAVYVHTVPKEISGYSHNKYYVGITCKDNPEKRWEHGYGYRGNEHFFRAITKYGWDNISHEIIAQGLSFQEACDMEKLFIALYNSKNKEYGYNKTYGGEGVVGVHMNEAECKRRSESFKGEKNPFYGKNHSIDTRNKMSERHYDCSGAKNPRARRVFQFSLTHQFIKKYDTVTDAAKYFNINDMTIHKAIKRKGATQDSFWAFENEVVKNNGTYQLKDKGLYIILKKGKEVAQYDTNGKVINIYESTADAQRQTGICKQNIGKVARRGYGLAGGFEWRYITDGKDCTCVN